MTYASILSEFWNDQILANEKQGLFLVLVGFILSFAFIRMSTRLMRSPKVPWWPGSVVSDGGVHLHHLVFGIVTMMIAGALGFLSLGESPYAEICAFFFGVGAGLTIDEFALWVYLDDVYWAEEGRRSVDAVVVAAVFMGIVFLGVVPFELDGSDWELFLISLTGLLIGIGTSAICFLKRRIGHGVAGLFFYPLAFYGAVRLAKPNSPWAKRRYGERNPDKQARAEKRFRHNRVERFYDSFRAALGGRPTESLEASRRESDG
jgi:hypothetical protein